jgi:hypothetical protein
LNSRVDGPCEDAFLSDDGQVLIIIESRFVKSPSLAPGIRFHHPSGLMTTVFWPEVCFLPRRTYPFETRGFTSTHNWLKQAEYDGTYLTLSTTGLFSCRIDVSKSGLLQIRNRNRDKLTSKGRLGRLLWSIRYRGMSAAVVERWVNYDTVARWLILALLLAFPFLVLGRLSFLGIRWVQAWRGHRALAHGKCQRCGYSLHGLPEPRCPECGTAFGELSRPSDTRA